MNEVLMKAMISANDYSPVGGFFFQQVKSVISINDLKLSEKERTKFSTVIGKLVNKEVLGK